jgi:predicted metal-dependent peptidase
MNDLKKSPEVPWYKYLTNRLCQAMSTRTESTRLRRNRRFGFIHPGARKKQQINVIVALDTSGSMSDNMLGIMKSNILSLNGLMEMTCTIVEFDSQVQRTYTIDKLDRTVAGRGGTSLNAPLQWILQTKQPAGTIVFVFTDGYGELDIDVQPFDKYPIHWMLPKDGMDQYIKSWRHKRSFINTFSFERKKRGIQGQGLSVF